MTIEKWQLVLAAFGVLMSILGGVGGTLWWVTKRVHSFVSNEKLLIQAARAQAEAISTVSQRVDRLAEAATLLSQSMRQREAETNKIEGQVQAVNTSLMTVIGGLQQAVGSLDAVWRTLQLLHPGVVPKRASDRG